MNEGSCDTAELGPGEVWVNLLDRNIRIYNQADSEAVSRASALLEQTFRDMERAYELRWGCPPSAQDTSTWMLMGALNLAHQVVRLEQAASQQTQDLELTLTKLLDDVPDEPLAPGLLFGGED